MSHPFEDWCLGVNVKPEGAGPSSISLILTQSDAKGLAIKVSRSFLPKYAEGLDLMSIGTYSKRPTGTYRCKNDNQFSKK